MKCPPALLAATCLLQVALVYCRLICIIEEFKPNGENLATLIKPAVGFFAMLGEARRWRPPIATADRLH